MSSHGDYSFLCLDHLLAIKYFKVTVDAFEHVCVKNYKNVPWSLDQVLAETNPFVEFRGAEGSSW